MTRDTSTKDAAAELGIHGKTLQKWCRDGAPHDRGANGGYLVDVNEVKAWADASGRTGQAGRPDTGELAMRAGTKDSFYSTFGPSRGRIKVELYDGIPGFPAQDATIQPDEICTPAERAIVKGESTPDAEQVRQLVAEGVRCKAMLAEDLEIIAGWLVGQHTEEIKRRLRVVVYERLTWHGGQVGRIIEGAEASADE